MYFPGERLEGTPLDHSRNALGDSKMDLHFGSFYTPGDSDTGGPKGVRYDQT